MVRYPRLKRMAALGVPVVAGVIALSALPAGSTIVCPTGVKPPSPYCTDVPPIARTDQASRVRGDSATLNGVAGPNVRNGDITQYFFKYGPTQNYGFQTPTGTIGRCPHGIKPPSPYCSVPKKQRVSARISDLAPCSSYHFQLYANNPDGSAAGGDRIFATGFSPPITAFDAPGEVSAGRRFVVFLALQYDTDRVSISIRGNGGSSTTIGPVPAGRYFLSLRAPQRRGNYVLEASARLSCGRQSVAQRLRVSGQGFPHR
jgi:hypothetical protein